MLEYYLATKIRTKNIVTNIMFIFCSKLLPYGIHISKNEIEYIRFPYMVKFCCILMYGDLLLKRPLVRLHLIYGDSNFSSILILWISSLLFTMVAFSGSGDSKQATNAYKDKSKPAEIRKSNITAAKGLFKIKKIIYPHEILNYCKE